MASDTFVAFIIGVGASVWIYGKLMRNTNVQKNSIIGSAVAGVIIFIVVFTLLKFIFHI